MPSLNTMPSSNAAIARRWFEEVWNQHRAETIDELVTDDSVCFTDNGVIRGPEQFREQIYLPFINAFPDLQVNVEEIICQDDKVVVRWTATGSHSGSGLGFAGTGRPAHFRGLTWIEIRDGKFGQGWQSSNIPEVVRSLATPGG